MSTFHFTNGSDYLDANSVYDSTQGKTPAEINEKVSVLLPSGVDQAQAIVAKLTADGVCKLGKGDFYVSNIRMPADTKLCGAGEATKLHFVDGASGNMVTMGDRCSVSDISFYGAEHLDSDGNPVSINDAVQETVSVDGDIPGSRVENEATTNLWTSGNVNVPAASKYVTITMQTPLEPGTYRFGVNIARSDSSSRESIIRLRTAAGSLVKTVYFTKNIRSVHIFTIEEPVTTIALVTTSNADALASEWQDIRLTKIVNDKSGICWTGDDVHFGEVHGCRFYYFNVSGILMQDTGTPVDRNLTVSDCFFFKCNVGIYIRKNSEYNRFSNCFFVRNYYGVLNRGGNNYFTNCCFDGNYVGYRADVHEGSNGGHGFVSNSSFNHSQPDGEGYGIVISNEEDVHFDNCVIGYSKVMLSKATGVILSNCYIGGEVVIEGGNSNMIANCYFSSKIEDTSVTPSEVINVVAIDNDKTKLINCFYHVGGAAVPLTTRTSS